MALRVKQFTKVEMYGQPHVLRYGAAFELDDATLDSTICPIAFYDEGLGAPTSLETHPENAAFAINLNQANCFINSRINVIIAQLRVHLTSKALDDNLTSVRMAFMPIHMAFIDDYTAIDELSTLEVQDVLEMQTESTDNQGGPLYVAGTDLPELGSNDALMHVTQPFLDTDAGLEAVAFLQNDYYDMLHFMTNAGKLKVAASGLHWFTLDQNRPARTFDFRISPKVKRMNKFTYFGILLHCPTNTDKDQNTKAQDITAATKYVQWNMHARYTEWNQDFNSRKV